MFFKYCYYLFEVDSGCLDRRKTSLESEETVEQGPEATFSSHPSAAITDDSGPSFRQGAGIWMNKAQQVTLSEAMDQLTRLMTQKPTEDNPGTEDNPSTEDNPGTEDNPLTDNSHTEDMSNLDDSPNAEGNPITVDNRNTEDNSNTANISNVKDKPSTVDNSSTGDNQNTKGNSNTVINPGTQKTPLTVKTMYPRVTWLLIGTQWEKLSDVPDECDGINVCVCGVSDGFIVIGGYTPKQGVKSETEGRPSAPDTCISS